MSNVKKKRKVLFHISINEILLTVKKYIHHEETIKWEIIDKTFWGILYLEIQLVCFKICIPNIIKVYFHLILNFPWVISIKNVPK